MPSYHAYLRNVTLQIDGVWEASTHIDDWPNANRSYPYWDWTHLSELGFLGVISKG
jgi:hypothetical protein